MKILYGVQGTGNGHITRARGMAQAFANHGVCVDYLFSGRDPDKFFDMDIFGDYRLYSGLTFVTSSGRIQAMATVLDSKPLRFLRDVRQLDLSGYDLVLSDYEPITAWAGKCQGVEVIGLGHQYAFLHPIPQHHGSFIQQLILRHFAPVSKGLGFHWHHFGHPILPPIAPVEDPHLPVERGDIVVYLPFESIEAITRLLRPFEEYRFRIYHPDVTANMDGHLCWNPPGRETFQRDLVKAEGVICNAGFELASEVLNLGRKLLVKPVKGQSEQLSNALALDSLGYGHVMYELNHDKVSSWLANAHSTQVIFPDVADAICRWLLAGATGDIAELASTLWNQTQIPDITGLTRTDCHLLDGPQAACR
jgi:uncharacterized protein (TIGR00661 family)